MILDFKHNMSAHCENGATSNLLRFYNIDLSEPMIFGLGSGLSFSFLPFLKMNGSPVVSFRPLPGIIFKRVTKSLKLNVNVKRFKNSPQKAMQALDNNLSKGIPTGMVVGAYFLTYFPEKYRFHFNAHNIVVFGKENNKYYISDSIMEGVETLSYEELQRVRYAKGAFAPEGKMYYINTKPKNIDINSAIKKSIKKTCKQMVVYPGNLIGVSAMRYLAKHILKWEKKQNPKQAIKNVCFLVRMQEEIGTGGAGFRYLYAAFLQEASKRLNNPALNDFSKQMTLVGDKWRQFAIDSARVCKSRQKEGESFKSISNLLIEISKAEEELFKNLLKVKL